MPNKKYSDWEPEELADRAIWYLKVECNAGPTDIKNASAIIAGLSTQGILMRVKRWAQKKIKQDLKKK